MLIGPCPLPAELNSWGANRNWLFRGPLSSLIHLLNVTDLATIAKAHVVTDSNLANLTTPPTCSGHFILFLTEDKIDRKNKSVKTTLYIHYRYY